MHQPATHTHHVLPPPTRRGRAGAGKVAAHDDLQRLYAARETAAKLVLADPVYSPIFQRIEKEIALAEAAAHGDALACARAIARQMATR